MALLLVFGNLEGSLTCIFDQCRVHVDRCVRKRTVSYAVDMTEVKSLSGPGGAFTYQRDHDHLP
jgi:hypothetical protein